MGIEIKTTSVAQAKGRMERLFQTYYKTMDSNGLQVYYHYGVKGLVIQTFSGRLLFSANPV